MVPANLGAANAPQPLKCHPPPLLRSWSFPFPIGRTFLKNLRCFTKEIYKVVSLWRYSNPERCSASFMVCSHVHQPRSRQTEACLDDEENSKSWEEIISNDEQARSYSHRYGCTALTDLHRLSTQSEEMLWPYGFLRVPQKPGSSPRSALSSPYLLWS